MWKGTWQMKLHHQKQFWLFAFLLRIHSRFMKCLYLMRNSLHTDIFYFLCCTRAIKAIKETSACRLYKHCNIISLNTEVDTNLLCAHTCIRGTQRQFLENICSEDDLRSRIFGPFVVKFLACLPLLGFWNIQKMV